MTDQSLRIKSKHVVPPAVEARPPPNPTFGSRLRALNIYTLMSVSVVMAVLSALMVMYYVNSLTVIAHSTADRMNQGLKIERATTDLRHRFDRFERDLVGYRKGEKKDLFGLVESFTGLRNQCQKVEDLIDVTFVSENDRHIHEIKQRFGINRRQIGFDLTTLTTSPVAIESIVESLNGMRMPLRDLVTFSQENHNRIYNDARQQVAKAERRIRFIAPVVVACWLVSMLLLIVVLRRARRRTRAL